MDEIWIKGKIFKLFLSEDVILKEINKVAIQINKDLGDKEPLFIVVLSGAFMFASDLIRKFDYPCEVSFVRLKSYQGFNCSRKMREIQGLIEDITDRHIVIIEDIIDTGHTMAYLFDEMKEKAPKSVKIASLLFKPQAFQLDNKPDYVAISIPNDFIVGYGLDYDGQGRNLRSIYKIKK
jgi:hypoxanthine phosphoribosyltransferase